MRVQSAKLSRTVFLLARSDMSSVRAVAGRAHR
jgi:hypothetical protein